MFMVLLTAPLGLIGVVAALLVFQAPLGFVAILGVTALCGMIMRNSVILVDQIERNIATGRAAWDAIIEATVRRARPILLTAAAAIFAMVPLSRSVFWGPMAIALMGGLLVATVLTLLVLPALYAAWFRVRRPGDKPVTGVELPFALPGTSVTDIGGGQSTVQPVSPAAENKVTLRHVETFPPWSGLRT
jgi:multidrug efflux pump